MNSITKLVAFPSTRQTAIDECPQVVPLTCWVNGFTVFFYFIFLYLPYLFSIHEKANCIAMFWTERPHSLGSCHFRVTCLPHKGGASRQVPCPRTQQANLPACSPQPPINAERQAGKPLIPFFKVFWYNSTRGMNPRSTDCEADAPTNTPSRRFKSSDARETQKSILTGVFALPKTSSN